MFDIETDVDEKNNEVKQAAQAIKNLAEKIITS